MYDTIKAEAEGMRSALCQRRRDLHRHAEPGWLEMRTSSLIAKKLAELGYKVLYGQDVCDADSRMGLPTQAEMEAHYQWAAQNGADMDYLPAMRGGFTGAVGILECGSGPTVALRFDIDALGVLECAQSAHKPTADGFASLTPGVMHACGHDGHAAIGLGVAELLIKYRDRLHGTVKLIFQPAEEGVRGAKSVVSKGHLDGVDYVLAGHIFPAGKAAGVDVAVIREGGSSGLLATSKLDITFSGRSAHAGVAPQLGRNAMLAAATAVLNIHAIPRFGAVPTQVNVGRLTAGTGRNVVCEKALLEVEVRGQTSEANDYMEQYALRIAESAAHMHECGCEVARMGSAAALECTWALSKRVLDVCGGGLGMKTLQVPAFGGGSEDFAYMSERVQKRGGEATYFGLLTDCPAPNHNDRFDFDENVLVNGVEAFTGTVWDLIGEK